MFICFRRETSFHTKDTKEERTKLSRKLLLLLRWDVVRRELRAFAEEELLHVMHDDLLRLLVRWVEAVFVDDHLGVLAPQPPRFLRDGLVDAVAQLAIERRLVEPGQLLAQLDAFHHALCHCFSLRSTERCAELLIINGGKGD